MIRCIRTYPHPPAPYAAIGAPFRAMRRTLTAVPKTLVSMGGYRLGEGWVENMDRGAFRRRWKVRKYLAENHPYRVLPAAVDIGSTHR
jgi:hypothetical protein